jgi:hypothetical protein
MNGRFTYKDCEAVPLAIQLVHEFVPSRFDYSLVYPDLTKRLAVEVWGVKEYNIQNAK